MWPGVDGRMGTLGALVSFFIWAPMSLSAGCERLNRDLAGVLPHPSRSRWSMAWHVDDVGAVDLPELGGTEFFAEFLDRLSNQPLAIGSDHRIIPTGDTVLALHYAMDAGSAKVANCEIWGAP